MQQFSWPCSVAEEAEVTPSNLGEFCGSKQWVSCNLVYHRRQNYYILCSEKTRSVLHKDAGLKERALSLSYGLLGIHIVISVHGFPLFSLCYRRVRLLVGLPDCVNSSPPLILRKFQGFGGIWANLAKFGKFREISGKIQGNSVEFSGVLYGA